MSKLLENKTAIITGATRGIGRGIAQTFALNGCNVAFTYNSSIEAAQTLEKELNKTGIKAKSYRSNAADFDQAQVLIDKVLEDFGTVDVLINNAGITKDNLLMRMGEEDFDKVIEVNLKSVFNMTKAVQRTFLKQRKGSLIHMSSVVGVKGNAGQANYAASKAGIKKHDIIFEFNGNQIASPSDLSRLISQQKGGEIAELGIIQKGSKKTITVNLKGRPDQFEDKEEQGNNIFKNQFDFGDLGGINFDILPFGNDQNLEQQIKEMQKQMRENLQGMFDLEGFDNLPGIGQMFGSSSQKMIYRDDEGTIEIQKSDGKTSIITKDLQGKITFEGPADTQEQKNNLPNNYSKIWFSQLYGMADHISFNLASKGYQVVKYIPYGPIKEVIPYLIRRAQENSSSMSKPNTCKI